MSLRAVLDTNIIVAAALTPDGFPDLVVRLAVSGSFQLIGSDELFLEYAEVLTRPAFGFSRRTVDELIAELRAEAVIVKATPIPDGICSDLDDAVILGTAVAGKADHLVTGNRKHFPTRYRWVHIITPKDFVQLHQQ